MVNQGEAPWSAAIERVKRGKQARVCPPFFFALNIFGRKRVDDGKF
jgi:hypothetical protein